jgi:hypothetical protein
MEILIKEILLKEQELRESRKELFLTVLKEMEKRKQFDAASIIEEFIIGGML